MDDFQWMISKVNFTVILRVLRAFRTVFCYVTKLDLYRPDINPSCNQLQAECT
jgi:hypothetical protein